MIAIEGIFSKKNTEQALSYFESKNHSDKEEKKSIYNELWELNKERIIEEAFQCSYQPDLVKEYEIISATGKKRVVAQFSEIDKFLSRLLMQKLNDFYNNKFSGNSYAYQPGKGVQEAVKKVKTYIEAGNEYVVEIDLRNYFDNISLEKLMELINEENKDKRVLALIKAYLYCKITNGEEVYEKQKGIIQGLSISPVLSNLYLHKLDLYLENREFNFVRYADNINIYLVDKDLGIQIYQDVCKILKREFYLDVNENKSGVYDVYLRRFLGYDFIKKGKYVKLQKHVY